MASTGESPGRVNAAEVQQAISQAETDDEINRVLEEHRPWITREFGMQALGEVRAMSTPGSGVPTALLGPLAESILHRVDLIGRFLQDDALSAECHFSRSRVLAISGNTDGAISELTAAASIFQRLGDNFRQAQSVGQIGSFQLELKRFDLAEQALNESIQLLETVEPQNDGLLAPTWEELAQIAGHKGDSRTAAGYFVQAGEARLRQGRSARAAFDFQASVPFFLAGADDDSALQQAERFLSLRETSPPEPPSVEVDELFMENIARYVASIVADAAEQRDPFVGWRQPRPPRHDMDKVRRWATLAKRGLGLTSQPKDQAVIHFAAALASWGSSEPRSTAEEAGAALPYFESHDDDVAYIGLVNLLAAAEQSSGHSDRALDVVERGLHRIADRGDPARTLGLMTQRAEAQSSLGRTSDAVETVVRALDLARAGDSPINRYYQGSLTAALGGIYARQRQIEAAVPVELEALRIARELGARAAEAKELTSLGVLCGMLVASWLEDVPIPRRGELLATIATQALAEPPADPDEVAGVAPREALQQRARELGTQLLHRAIEAYRDVGDLVGEAIAQGNLSNFVEADDELRFDTLVKALVQLRQSGGQPRNEEVIVANLGKTYMRMGSVTEAQACLDYSLSLSDSSGDYEWAYDTAADLARTYLAQGMSGDGVKYLRRAVDYTEASRRGLPLEDSARVAFARGKFEAYEQLVSLYLQRDRVVDAFDVVQRAKSRALIDLSGLGAINPTVPVTADLAALLQQEEALFSELRSHAAASTADSRSGKRALPEIRAELDEVYEQLQPIDPRYVGMRAGRPIRLQELQQTLAAQPRPILLVDYFVQPDRVIMFLVRSDSLSPICVQREVEAGRLAAWRDEFERQVIQYRGRGPQTWSSMASVLLEPIADYLRPGDLLYLIPHGLLHGLPLHALPLPDGVLFQLHPVVYLPAASLLPLCQTAGRNSNRLSTCCAIGVEFEDEARAVAAMFAESELILGEATAAQIATACTGRDVVHFSSHGYYDALDSSRSGLVITQSGDGVLTSDEIVRMRLESELVCLSACQSGVGRLVQGDEQLGILRAFLLAGASSVMSTLWPVEAQSTRELVEAFYTHLLASFRATGSIDKSAALQRAQLEIMQRRGAAGAYHWAPFMISGDWK